MQWVGSRSYGVTLVAFAGVLWSTGGLFVRWLEALDLWTMLAWRSLFAALALAAVIFAFHRARTFTALRRMGRPGLVAIPIALVSMTSFVVSVTLTTVANVMIVYATVPFIAAGIGFLWNGERPSRRMLAASAAAFLGVAIMAGASASLDDLLGNAVALLMTTTFATQLVMARRYPTLEMAPVNGGGAALCALLFFPFASAVVPDADQLVILALFGIATTAGAYVLFLVGGRYIPSGEAGLVGMLDVVLAPLWVWLLFDEQPGVAALVGGSIVMASVLWYLVAELRRASAGRA
ncbi:DMT family transporter [Dongia sedimenti]|uniref:DMT family transporter n=1 Tax=Dongia sedimenti TaxID=3064282 RepID=A0ABU0YFH6_9PROT|nr:DMT family transporter [Rhodospirillaceae bacterium R-7]